MEEIDIIFDTRTRQSLSNVEAAGCERAATVSAGATDKLPHKDVIHPPMSMMVSMDSTAATGGPSPLQPPNGEGDDPPPGTMSM